MAVPGYIQKTLQMKPEVSKIFDDLEAWHDYCRFNLMDFNPADLYKSQVYKDWQRRKNGGGYRGNNFRPNYNGERGNVRFHKKPYNRDNRQ